jgi:hypothetical protein
LRECKSTEIFLDHPYGRLSRSVLTTLFFFNKDFLTHATSRFVYAS